MRAAAATMGTAYETKPLPKRLQTAARYDERDEVPAVISPAFYRPPPPPLPKEPRARKPTRADRARAKAVEANMGIAYALPRKKPRKAPDMVTSAYKRPPATPAKTVTIQTDVRSNVTPGASPSPPLKALPRAYEHDVVFGCPGELRRGFYLKEDGWFPSALLYRDWARLRPNDDAALDFSDRFLDDGNVARISEVCSKVQTLCLKRNALLTSRGVEATVFASLQSLDLADCPEIDDRACEHLRRHAKSLTSVDVSGTGVGDAGVQSLLAGLKYLKNLYLRRLGLLNDAGIVAIAEVLKRKRVLRVLDFRESPNFRNDALLQLLADGGAHLTELYLGKCRQVNALALLGLRRELGTLNLKVLDIAHLPKLRGGTTLLAGFATSCRHLVELRLGHLPECVDDDALLSFAEACTDTVPPLEFVDLSHNYNVSARGLAPFLEHVKDTIRVLDVSLCNKLDDAFGAALAPCLQLDEVTMVDCPLFGDRGLMAWARGPPPAKDRYGKVIPVLERSWHPGDVEPKRIRLKLKRLALKAAFSGTVDVSSRCRVPRYAEPGLRHLVKTCGKFLRHLNFDGAPRVNDDCVKTIARYCPALHQLGLDGCASVTDDGIGEIGAKCHHLERLSVKGCGLTDRSAQALGSGCPALKFLDASRCGFTKEGLKALAAGCRGLEVLKLYGCFDVEDGGVDAVLTCCTSLKTLNVGSCDLLTDACLAHVAHCRELRTLQASSVNRGRGFQKEALKACARVLPYATLTRDGLQPVSKGVERLVQFQERARTAYAQATRIQARVRRNHAVGVMKASTRRRDRERRALMALMCIQRCIRNRRALLRYRELLKEQDRQAAHDAFQAAADYLLELEIARQLLKRQRKQHIEDLLLKYMKRGRALAFVRFWFCRDEHRWFQTCVEVLQGGTRRYLAYRLMVRRYRAATQIEALGRVILARVALAKRYREHRQELARQVARQKMAEIRAVRTMQKKIEVAKVEAAKVEEKKQERKNELETLIFAQSRKDLTPYEREKRERRDAAWKIQLVCARPYIQKQVEKRHKAAYTIQRALRVMMVKDMVKRFKRHQRKVVSCWERMGHPNVVVALTEKRRVQAELLAEAIAAEILRKGLAKLKLQKFFRARLARNRAVKYWLHARENRFATVIQRRFRVRATQKAVVAMNRSYNKACFRIAMLWAKRKARIKYKEIQKDMEAKRQEEAMAHKQELMRRKNFNTVKKCFESGRDRAAVKVQKKWRENREESGKRARRCAEHEEALQVKRLEFAMAEKAKEAKALAARALYHGRLFAMKAAKRAAEGVRATARDLFNAAAGISEEDVIRRGYDLPEVKRDTTAERMYDVIWKGSTEPRQKVKEQEEQMESSILNLQSRSLAPRGIVDFQITCGRQELTAMNEKMDHNKSVKQPVFERIKKDLSTTKGKIYLWVLLGSGTRVLTAFTVKRAPPNHKNKGANESRVFGAFISGTVIRGHDSLSMEIHADAGIFRGESAPPIDQINLSRNDKEAASYKKLGWEEVSPAINSCGDKIGKFNLVVHRKKFHKKVVLNVLSLGILKREKWWTNEQRLVDMVEVYALPVDAIRQLRETFDELNYGANDRIETRDWLESLGEQKEPMPMYMKWLLELVETESLSGAHITFGEYVGSVCYLCMFDMIGMLRWLFKSVTGRESCFLEKTDYDMLTKGLMMTNPLPYRSDDIDQLYTAYCSERGEVYFEDWVKIAERLPMLLFALLRFQASVMQANLGEPFWFKKKGDFDALRNKLGVERASMLT